MCTHGTTEKKEGGFLYLFNFFHGFGSMRISDTFFVFCFFTSWNLPFYFSFEWLVNCSGSWFILVSVHTAHTIDSPTMYLHTWMDPLYWGKTPPSYMIHAVRKGLPDRSLADHYELTFVLALVLRTYTPFTDIWLHTTCSELYMARDK